MKDGDLVERWTDRGPRKNDLVRLSGKPTFVKECIGGLPAVRFQEGRTDGMRTSVVVPALVADPEFTVFLVAKIADSAKVPVQPLGWGDARVGAGRGMLLEFESGRLDVATGFSADASTSNKSYEAHFGKPTIVTCTKMAGPLSATVRVAYNGQSEPITGADLVPNVCLSSMVVGAEPEIGNVSPAMDVAEILVFGRALSADEQNRVGHYLARKYGLDTAYTKPDKPGAELQVRAEPETMESAVGFIGQGLQTKNATVEITAQQSVVLQTEKGPVGYSFDCWTGDGEGMSPKLSVTMSANKKLTAVYKEQKMEFHISPNGPLATLAAARDEIRKLKLQWGGVSRAPVKVIVHGGKYFLNEPLALGPEDSGTAECPVVYAASPGEQPILSGGMKVSGWQPYKEKIHQCAIPAARGGNWKFRQLFYNGQAPSRAQTPNWAKTTGPAEPGSYTAFTYAPGTFPRRWAKPREAEVNLFVGQDWFNNIIPIQAMDEQRCIITLARCTTTFTNPPSPLPYNFPTPFTVGQRFRVENVLEELDQPGEWCWDSEAATLYFWPPDDLLGAAEVVIPRLHNLVSLHGGSHVILSGLTFTETNGGDNFHHDGCEGVGAMFPMPSWPYCGDAVHLKDAEHCVIEQCQFRNIGGNAIYLEGHNARNIICRNEFADIGACGVSLAGTGDRYPIFNRIEDNHIHHVGRLNTYAVGVFLALSEGNIVGHNSIHDVPHHAVNLGNTGRSHNIVEYNDIRRTCLENFDTGAINVWMEDDRHVPRQGHIIRYNLIMDSRERGIYLDNYSSNCQVFGNIIIRSRNWAITVHGGKNNVIENNIIISSAPSAIAYYDGIDSLMPHMAGFFSGHHFSRNIIYGAKQTTYVALRQPERCLAESDFNLFFRVDDADTHLQKSRQAGHEIHSVIADPLFIAPDKDDYRLQPASPALQLGFQPIELAKIGIRK